MTIRERRSNVEELVQKELEGSDPRFSMFHSGYEGAAAIYESIERAKAEMYETEMNFKVLWTHVKLNNAVIASNHADDLYRRACKLACEAIQVAAMAQKFIDRQKEMEKSENE